MTTFYDTTICIATIRRIKISCNKSHCISIYNKRIIWTSLFIIEYLICKASKFSCYFCRKTCSLYYSLETLTTKRYMYTTKVTIVPFRFKKNHKAAGKISRFPLLFNTSWNRSENNRPKLQIRYNSFKNIFRNWLSCPLLLL